MNKICAMVLGTALTMGAAGQARAGLLDMELSKPLLGFDGGATTYSASTGVFEATSTVLAGQFDGVVLLLPLGSATIDMSFRLRPNGTLRGGVNGPDLTIVGTVDVDGDGNPEYTGTLLTGEAKAFGWQEAGSTDVFDAQFDVTGGSMAGLYGKTVGVEITAENSTFNGSFCTDFIAGAKGTVGTNFGENCPKKGRDWKNDCSWPLSGLSIGGVQYNQTQLRRILNGRFPDNSPGGADLTLSLAQDLIAAKLSLADGAVGSDDLAELIALADSFLAALPLGTPLAADQADVAMGMEDGLEDYLDTRTGCGGGCRTHFRHCGGFKGCDRYRKSCSGWHGCGDGGDGSSGCGGGGGHSGGGSNCR